ncbi:uncharacterized protein LOC115624894 [Scaptodrosophila lebanonensis]|uniref:Uncharacterized protein LOC115624894 n=1 Tax=Drosophila lebanonensis TaxID=7225 RepID=A0A6J2TKQ2_DROLE|nr:uncharacterized protein LOC115624894 [Scaptodrosophila lebanonensis]
MNDAPESNTATTSPAALQIESEDSTTSNDVTAQFRSYIQSLPEGEKVGCKTEPSSPLDSNSHSHKIAQSAGSTSIDVVSSNKDDKDKLAWIAKQRGLPTLPSVQQNKAIGQELPFSHKLHLVASSEKHPYLSWTTSGQELQLEYIGLQQYLANDSCIFKSRTLLQFIQQLRLYGFKRVWLGENPYATNQMLTSPPLLLYYQHPDFDRDANIELMNKPQTPTRTLEVTEETLFPLGNASEAYNERMRERGDLCSSFYTFSSPLELRRARLQTLLRYQMDERQLRDHAYSSELLAQLVPRRGRTATKAQPEPLTTQVAKYVKPQESVLSFVSGYCPEYAGYYGNVPVTKINDFFSEFLPRYGNKTTGYKDIVTDASSKVNTFQQNLPIGLSFSEDEDEGGTDEIIKTSSKTESGSKAKKNSKRSKPEAAVDDMELEEAMQALCGGEDESQTKESQKVQQTKANDDYSTSSEDMDMDEAEPEEVVVSSDSEIETREAETKLLKVAADAESKAKNTTTNENESDETDTDEDDVDDDDYDDDDEDDEDVGFEPAPPSAKRSRYDLRTLKRSS